MPPTPLTVALDWTPNTNHIGFYVAKAQGLYLAAGLDVTLLSTHHDAYKRTPASRVADGSAAFAVTPTESIVSSQQQPVGSTKPPLVAVAALQQRTTSAIVTLKASGRDTPAKLDGATYASYGARYEGRIVQALIKKGGRHRRIYRERAANAGHLGHAARGQGGCHLGVHGVRRRAGRDLRATRRLW